MKKICFIIIVCILQVTLLWSVCKAEDSSEDIFITENSNIKIIIDGRFSVYQSVPIIVDGRTLLPFRELAVNLGVANDREHIVWNASEQSVSLINNSTNIQLKVNSEVASVNGTKVTLDSKPLIYKDHIYIPVRFIANAFGKEAGWDGRSETITIFNDKTLMQVKTAIENAEKGLKAMKKFKSTMIIDKSSFGYAEILLEKDRNKDLCHLTIACGKKGSKNYVDYYDVFQGDNYQYSRSKPNGEWEAEQKGDLMNNMFLESPIHLEDALFGALTLKEAESEIIIEGDISADDRYGDTGDESYRAYSKIVIDKKTQLYKEINISVSGNISEGHHEHTGQYYKDEFSCKYDDIDGDFQIEIPDGIDLKAN